ncbi:hypothetical protein JCM10207_000086 [Rhodosporidiobolus poonsookiae]
MPHVRLPTTDHVQLFYESFPPRLPASSSSSSRPGPPPSLLLLSPLCLDTTFLTPYVERFTKEGFAVTVLDLRSHGRSKNGAYAAYDGWALAAEVAAAMEALQLPPSHVFASGCSAFQAALKLTVLFPSLVLSLSLSGASTLFAPPRALEAFVEITEKWVRPDDEEEWIDVLGGLGEFLLGEKRYEHAEDIWDRVLGTVARSHNPYTAQQIFMVTAPNQRSPGLTPEMLGNIKQPIQIFQGDNDFCFGLEEVEEQTTHFTGAKEMDFHAVEDGPHLLALTHSRFVLSHMSSFLRRHTRGQPPFYTPPDYPAALALLSTFLPSFCDPSDPASCSTFASTLASRSPFNPDSFSLVTPEEMPAAIERLEGMMAVERECELELPMCFEKDDWVIEEEAEQVKRESGKSEEEQKAERWTWSSREDYPWPSTSANFRPRLSLSHSLQSHPISTTTTTTTSDPHSRPLSMFSLDDVHVQVKSEAQTSPRPEVGPAGGGLLEGLVRPVREKESSVSTGPATRVN